MGVVRVVTMVKFDRSTGVVIAKDVGLWSCGVAWSTGYRSRSCEVEKLRKMELRSCEVAKDVCVGECRSAGV